MQRSIGLLGGIGVGAVAMYFLDADRGRRRRALLRDGITRGAHQVQHQMGKAARDLENRTSGVSSLLRGKFNRTQQREAHTIDDSVLEARVRSELGRCVSHPHAIHVKAESGCITLSGDILADEVNHLLNAVTSVSGVAEVRNKLSAYGDPRGVSSLQGQTRRSRTGNGSARAGWTPALRLLAGAGGGALTAYGMVARGWPGIAAGIAGAGLMARAAANRRLPDLLSRNGEATIQIQKTVHVLAPIEEVFTFLTRFSNLPRFMSHLREIQDVGNGRYRWTAEGPGHVPVTWESEISKLVPNQLVEWRSLPGSMIVNHGKMRFDPDPDGGTRISVQMAYSPPGGMAGHLVARLFGADPKREMDDDFVRLKSLLELGKTRGRDGRVLTYDPEHRSVFAT
jgi:uncharacterized membrane protein